MESTEPDADKLTIIEDQTRNRCSRSTSSSRSKSMLPCGVGEDEDNIWGNVFVPTYYSYIGALKNPWHLDVKASLKALQDIWDAIFPDKPHKIESVNDKVYSIVSLPILMMS